MKIGILTYHRTNNYGACLQAVATRLVLEQIGHEAYYVDYWPDYHADTYKVFAWGNMKKMNFKGKLNYLKKAFSNIPEKKERIANFNFFLQQYILPYCRPVSEQYDVILYGSDQIWRKQSSLKAYNPVYFGKNDFRANLHIAFAASMGILPKSESDKKEIIDLVSHFDRITVREDDLKDFLLSSGISGVQRIVDPTLLVTGDNWKKKFCIPEYQGKPYLLVYCVTKPAFDMNEVKRFAEEKNLEIKILCGSATSGKNANVYSTADPVQFLTLIMNARYTFVSSFHGLAFSILFHKEVYASFFNNTNRAQTLLDTLAIEGRLLPPKISIKELEPIDYSAVEKVLAAERQKVYAMINSFWK